jgi:hypothetical protein
MAKRKNLEKIDQQDPTKNLWLIYVDHNNPHY